MNVCQDALRRLVGLSVGVGWLLRIASAHGANVADWRDGYSLIVLSNSDIQACNQARNFVVSQGGRIAVVSPPHVMLGWIPPEIEPRLLGRMGIVSIHHKSIQISAAKFQDAESMAAIRFFNHVASGESKSEEDAAATTKGMPLINDALPAPDNNPNLQGPQLLIQAPSTGTSDYMTGTVAVALFFVQSDGAVDTQQYTWSLADEQSTYNRAVTGLSWWSSQAPNYGRSVSFTVISYSSTNLVTHQGYEPIIHDSNEEGLWVSAIMTNLGFTTGGKINQVRAFDKSLRTNSGTDWAYSVFVGYNPSGAPTKFTDGYFSYAYLGGPYVQTLYSNDGWGASNFGLVLTHETGHIFWACDEYYQAGYGGCTSCGTCVNAPGRSIPNGNCEYCNSDSVPCIMRENSHALCPYTPSQIGWQPVDSIGDGIPNAWRQQYFGDAYSTNHLSCAACDADGTAQRNLFKYIAGLDPTNPASIFILQLASVPDQQGQKNLMYGPLAAGRTYAAQSTSNLVGGVYSALTNFTGPQTNGNQATITDLNAVETAKFYRVRISLP